MAKNTVIVSITANTKGLQKGLGDASSLLGGLGGLAKVAVGTIAAIGAGLAGLAVGGGISRAIGLDTANTKFKALGYTGEQIETIMESALASVKGTAFGLDAAGTVAANALAAGIKPGDELTRVLSTIADTAALSGSSMEDVGAIFNKIASNTKVTTMEMNQLADRGVPVWQYLADSIGVSIPELRKMVEAGEISSDMFLNAMEPAVAGVADTMGGSFLGSLKNAQAALSRLGAAFVAPALPVLTSLLGEFMTVVDGLAVMLQPAADKFGAWLSTINTEGVGQSALDFITAVIEAIPDFITFITEVSPLSAILQALIPILPTIADLIGRMADAALEIADALAPLIPIAVELFSDLLIALLPVAVIAVESLVSIFEDLAPVIEDVVTFIEANKDQLLALGVAIAAGIVAFKLYGAALLVKQGIVKGATAVQKLFNAALKANPIGLIISLVAGLVAGLIFFFTQTETGKKIWEDFTTFLREAWENIVGFITDALENISEFFTDTWENISSFFEETWDNIIGFLQGVLQFVVDLFLNWTVYGLIIKNWDAIIAFFRNIPTKISEVFRNAISFLTTAGTNIIKGLKNGIDGFWTNVVSFFTNLPGVIGGFVSNAANWLVSAGRNIIDGLLTGLRRAGGAIKDFLLGLIGGAVDAVKSFLGIRSPSKLFAGLGLDVGKGLVKGLDGSKRIVNRAMGDLSGLVSDGFTGSLSAGELSMSVRGNAGASASSGNVYNVNVNTLNSTAETGRVIIEAIRDYERTGGRL